jgi:iron complex outermembrane receptor protein
MDNVWSVRNDVLGFEPILAIPHIDPVTYVDVAAQWQVTANLRLRAGVDNVFEAEPRLLGSDQVQANTDPSRYDVFGRRVFMGVDVRFKD